MELNRTPSPEACLSSMICTQLALPNWAKPKFKMASLPEALRQAVTSLNTDLRVFRIADRNYRNSRHDYHGPWQWREHYDGLLQSYEVLCEELTDDTPLNRAVLSWANRIVPPPCRQAIDFWQPIPDLSEEFQPLLPRMFEDRARYAITHWNFWSKYPYGHRCTGTLEEFQSLHEDMHEACSAWIKTYVRITESWAETQGDRELGRRAVQSIETGDIIDVPHLQRTVPDWKPYDGWPVQRRCPLPCANCDQLLGPKKTAIGKDDM